MSKRVSTTAFGSNNPISVREDKKHSKGSSINPKAALKLDHLQRLALWTGGEASIPSFGAFFGHKLASIQEGLDVPLDPYMVSCQRAKARRRSKKPANFTFTQNNVVYTCHFCSERNVKRGTSRGHMKAMCSLKIKKASDLKPAKSISQKFATPKKTSADEVKVSKLKTGTPTADEENPSIVKITSTTIVEEILTVDSPTTPMVKPMVALLDSKGKKRNKSASKKRPEPEISPALTDVENSTSTTNKRRRKSWTSLKELAERNEQKKNISDLSIPFFV